MTFSSSVHRQSTKMKQKMKGVVDVLDPRQKSAGMTYLLVRHSRMFLSGIQFLGTETSKTFHYHDRGFNRLKNDMTFPFWKKCNYRGGCCKGKTRALLSLRGSQIGRARGEDKTDEAIIATASETETIDGSRRLSGSFLPSNTRRIRGHVLPSR